MTQKQIMFHYTTFWREFRRLGTPAPDVECHEYIPDYHAIKYHSKNGTKQKFKHQGMQARRLTADDPLVVSQPTKYQHGAFVVFARTEAPEEEERAKRGKNLYIVDLARHTVLDEGTGKTRTFYTADHFSLLADQHDASETKLHLHRTKYTPQTFSRGIVNRIAGHLPLEFPLANHEDLRKRLGMLTLQSPWVYSILTRVECQYHHNSQIQDGGTRGRHRRNARRRGRVATFDDIFVKLPVARLSVFAIPRPGSSSQYDVTVFVRRRAPHMSRGQNDLCFSFEVSSEDVTDELRMRAHIASAFEGVERRDFEAPERTLLDEDDGEYEEPDEI